MILANDDRPRTMHAEAERTPPHLLPPVVADLLDRNEHRRADRRQTWRHNDAEARRRAAAYERIISADEQSHDRSRSDDGYGLEL